MREKFTVCKVSSSIIHWITMGTDSWAISTSVREAIPVRNEYLYRKIREEMLVFLSNSIR